MSDEEVFEDEEETYMIVRYRFKGENEVIARRQTLEEARDWCNLPETEGDGWFDGYTKEA